MKLWPELAIRDADGGEILELFLVAAVASLLAIRAFLALTGYPQVGGEHLHIAHMLWGGLFMLAALVMLISYWSPGVRWLAGLLGGVGFGTFIDELGKFITKDNDYFFQPTFALIYAIFVVLVLSVRALHVRTPLSELELRANAALRAVLLPGDASAGRETDRLRQLVQRAGASYERLVLRPWFRNAITALFVAVAVWHVGAVLGVELFGRHRGGATAGSIRALASAVSGLFVVIGALRLPRSRLDAYRWFQRALLVSILVVEFFVFLDSALLALAGHAVDLLLYLALGFMIYREEADAQRPSRA